MSRRARPRPAAPAPTLPLTHPAALLAIAIAASCALVSVSFRLSDTDLWQLLVVGKATWTLHHVPTTDLWTWSNYGAPQVASSWLFRALLWPLWDRFGITGLYAWRWVSTLAAFGLAWATARRLGARGLLPLVVMAWGVLVYRLRSDARPETFAAVLFACQLWILETRRSPSGGAGTAPDRSAWIVLIAWIWANAHVSYQLGLLLTGVYLVAAWLDARRAGSARSARRLLLVLAASIAVSVLNPSGVRALLQPFQFFFEWRNEPLYQAIVELQPLAWRAHLRSGLPLLLAGWPLLALARSFRPGPDAVEWMLCALFTPLAFSSQRFLGAYTLAAAPFVARDLQSLVEAIRWPAWTAAAGARGALAAAACVAIGIPEWTRIEIPLGIGFVPAAFPERACDFIGAHGIRGRAFNHFHLGGYMAYRFWPERERLPFMTTQPENSPREDRMLYIMALADRAAWLRLDGQRHFDYLLLARPESPGERLEEGLEGDSTWAMVFADDAAELFVRRGGASSAVADSFAYRVIPPSEEGRRRLIGACATDMALRRRAARELERQAADSPLDGSAHHMLGILAMMDGRLEDARRHFARTLARKPLVPGVHLLLGLIALDQRDPVAALQEFRTERKLHGEAPGLDLRIGQAYRWLGETGRARAAFRREVDRNPENAEARDSLAALERSGRD